MSNLLLNDNNEPENTFFTDEEDKENRSYVEMINEVSQIVKETAAVEDECQPLVKEVLILDKKSPSGVLRQRNRHDSRDRRDNRRTSFAGLDACGKDAMIDPNLKKCNLYDYIYQEVRRTYLPENDEARYIERREKFYMFLKIPRELEKFIWFGFLQCLDAFLSLCTLLPLRFLLSFWFLITRSLSRMIRSTTNSSSADDSASQKPILQPAEICDLLKGIILICGGFLLSYLDTSMLYHIIKSQSVIKLYIFFNMLELAEKLITSFGLDILDALYWTATEPRGRRREHIGVIPHLAISILYIFVHTIIILLQATTLNVAINSSNKALLTIMMSNNFVEIKGMVFKKFEKNNLFHMSCYDVKERFHLLILLVVVVIQTMREYNWDESHFWILMPDCFFIFLTEFGVDWVKHCFVTRFNDLSYDVYHTYTVSLSYDLAGSNLKSAFSDHIDLISKRVGFIPLPLGLLLGRIFYISVPIKGWYGCLSLVLGYLCIVTLKIWLNILLLGKAFEYIENHRTTMDKENEPPQRQCSSLPSSRHQSLESIPASLHSKSTMNLPYS